MKISIIIPVHNLEREIEQCLNSIYAQDFDKREYETLLILDSCTDNRKELFGHGTIYTAI